MNFCFFSKNITVSFAICDVSDLDSFAQVMEALLETAFFGLDSRQHDLWVRHDDLAAR